MADIEFRPIGPHELVAFDRAESRGFGGHFRASPEGLEHGARFLSNSRTLCAFDAGEMVGTSASYTLDLSVPGGSNVAMSGVTGVTVSPSHRRRGILTEMMRRLLEIEHELDIPVAGLWASESIIYGRFGYGVAVQEQVASIRTRHSAFRQPFDARGKIRFADASEVRSAAPVICRKTMPSSPGMVDRLDFEWEHDFQNRVRGQDRFYVVYEEKGEILGYAKYRLEGKIERMPSGAADQHGGYELFLIELIASTPIAQAALWRFVLDIDLVHTVTHWQHPMRSSLMWSLSDPRRLSLKPYDALWLRILDPAAALAARSYNAPGTFAIELIDDFCPWAAGTFRLDADEQGDATCSRTSDEADVTMPIASLAAVYLGAHQLTQLQRAGRIDEHSPGSVAALQTMFATTDAHSVIHEF